MESFKVSGIYQDVTSGGKTAKSKHKFENLPVYKYSFSVNLKENTNVINKAEEWTKSLGSGVSVDPMEDFIDQTLGGVSRQLRTIVFAIIAIGGFLAMLITVLFLKLRLAKDLSEIAVLKAIGFSVDDITWQHMIKIGTTSILGILGGTFITNLLGKTLVNAALGLTGLGIKEVSLVRNPAMEYIIVPLLLIFLILLVTRIVMGTIKKYNIMSIINE